jgi:hypothetical protein
LTLSLIARMRRRRFAAADLFDAPFVCQATVGELSLQTPTCSW